MNKSRFLETLMVLNGELQHAEDHHRRMERTAKEAFGTTKFDFPNIVVPPEYHNGIVKCRIVYGEKIDQISFAHYTPLTIRSLRIVEAPPVLDYHLKYADRSELNALSALRNGCDEVLIVKDGELTDTSYSNIVLSDGAEFITPRATLLNGTRRQRLLSEGKIRQEKLTPGDLGRFREIILINAMLGLEEPIAIPTDRIFY